MKRGEKRNVTVNKQHRSLHYMHLLLGSLQGEYQRRLYKELMRNYNPLERPVQNDSHSLSVSFSFSLLQIMDVVRSSFFNSHSNVLDYGWVLMGQVHLDRTTYSIDTSTHTLTPINH